MNDTATAAKTRPRHDPRATGGRLHGKTVAILATDGYERSELRDPKEALEAEGAIAEVISPKSGAIKAWKHGDWADEIHVDHTLAEADPARYDALVLPGGTINADHLRANASAVEFVKAFFERHKPVGAICHAPWLLVEADVCKSRRLTSWPSLKTDVRNAGGDWVDEEVVRDDQLVTSRKPDDLPAFNASLVELVANDSVEPRVKVKVAAPDVS
ncbi:MAG TPA: type 1 glutamine amidotransferase domain-containing protein [Nevskiaceae bacterium]|nr:type 1 glutamine amidotransferase domain-containing protein [Nevskiaceae bacterium]